MRRVKVNDVIQCNEKTNIWEGCLMIVEEVKEWGVLAGLKIPNQGTAYLRLKHDQYELIGKAVLVPQKSEEQS